MTVIKTRNRRQPGVYSDGHSQEVDTMVDATKDKGHPSKVIVIGDIPNRSKRHYSDISPPPQLSAHSPAKLPVKTSKQRKLDDSTQGTSICDKDGYFIFKANGYVTQRFQMIEVLGQGTFGTVIKCLDRLMQRYCALKIIRARQKYRNAATSIEIRALKLIQKHDPKNLKYCLHLCEWFDYQNHICLVFDCLDQSVYDYLVNSQFKSFSLGQIQHFARQIFTSLKFVHTLNLVHTDLKPENILLVNLQESPSHMLPQVSNQTSICLIDFGSVAFGKGPHSYMASTLFYRAPEFILGKNWSYPIDMWSAGCILVELYTGYTLFNACDNLELLAMMEVVVGKIPNKMVVESRKNGENYFKRDNSVATKTRSKYNIQALRSLYEIIRPSQSQGNALFLDLLQKTFTYDPSSRITASEALCHPFFQCGL